MQHQLKLQGQVEMDFEFYLTKEETTYSSSQKLELDFTTRDANASGDFSGEKA